MMAITKALFFFLFLTVGLSLPMGSEEPISEGAVPLDIGVDSQVEAAASVVETTASSPQNTEAHLTVKSTPTESQANSVGLDDTSAAVPSGPEPNAPAAETEPSQIPDSQPESPIKSTPTESQADSVGLDDTSAAAPSGPEPNVPAAETEPSQSPDSQPESPMPATNVNDQVNVAGPAGGVDEVELSAGEHPPVVQLGVTEAPGDVAASEVDEANAEQETLNRLEESPAGSESKQEIQPHFEEENQPLLVANEELEESQEKPRVEAAESLAISQFELRTSLLAAMLGVSHLLLHAF